MKSNRTFTTFHGTDRVVTGSESTMLEATKAFLTENPHAQLLIFDHSTGREVDYDLRGTTQEVLEKYASEEPKRGPGRPKLGVVAREVTLLPRHWEWLADQPNGASASLRRLVEEASRSEDPSARARTVTGRVMTTLAGDLPNYEEAYRALDAGDAQRFSEMTATWPHDVAEYVLSLARAAFRAE